MGATVLVTGGAGFIGSHVTDRLIDMGRRVVVLDDLSGGFRDNVNPAAEFTLGSVADRALVDRLFAQHRFTHVYHLAAYAAEGLSHFIRSFNYTNNLLGSVNLINAAVNTGVETFVFTSSIAVYGANQLPMEESLAPQPEDPYGIAKFSVEQDLKACHEMFGLKYIIFRPHNVYGERQNIGDKYRSVIGIFMNQLMQDQPMSVFGDGEQTRAFSYIGDIAPVIARSVEVPGAINEVFNVGADTPYTVNELTATVAKAMGAQPNVERLAARLEVMHAYCSHAKVERVFGKLPQTSLAEGVGRMAEWARRVGARSTPKFKDIEIERNLPPSWR